MALPKWVTPTPEGIRISLTVKANARKSGFELKDGILKLCIKAPAVEGKANHAIVEFVADFFGIKKSQVEFFLGEKQKQKVLTLHGISPEKALQLLGE